MVFKSKGDNIIILFSKYLKNTQQKYDCQVNTAALKKKKGKVKVYQEASRRNRRLVGIEELVLKVS